MRNKEGQRASQTWGLKFIIRDRHSVGNPGDTDDGEPQRSDTLQITHTANVVKTSRLGLGWHAAVSSEMLSHVYRKTDQGLFLRSFLLILDNLILKVADPVNSRQ